MRHPLVYQINTRCWLRDLSNRHSRRITLATIPEAEFERWQALGFTHLWLMGVWPTGPRSRDVFRASPHLRRSFDETLPDWQEADVAGSPFAVADYAPAEALGGEAGLRQFRGRLHAHGLKLILDFVPNHLGLDHPWVLERPDLFIQADAESDTGFSVQTKDGPRRLAPGKDPNFSSWIDTVQLDYRREETHTAMIEVLKSVADRCDGVRCDMAMLLLKDVFAKNWEHSPCSNAPTDREFWVDAIQSIRGLHREFLFLGEVYWDLEARLQSLGFDYTYDKSLYDYLVYRKLPEVQRHLLGAAPGFLAHSAHFLENHDEPRIASLLSLAEHRAAALLMVGLPGLRLLHEGQLAGWRILSPVQLGRRPAEAAQPEVESFYARLLAVLQSTAVGQGEGRLPLPRPAWADNPTAGNFVVVQWQSEPDSFDLVAINLAPDRSQCYVTLSVPELTPRNWRMKDLLGDEEYQRFGDDLQNQGLYLDLPPHGAQVFHFSPR